MSPKTPGDFKGTDTGRFQTQKPNKAAPPKITNHYDPPQYMLREGWTKEKMLDVLLSKNDGTKSMGRGAVYNEYLKKSLTGSVCLYKNEQGNRCAVGCFLPEGHPSEKVCGDYRKLLGAYPDVEEYMPLDQWGMLALQMAHDVARNSTHEAFRSFVEKNVCSN